jgi:hypothetical protein
MQHMHTIPVTILDNFFDDPNKIRNWALQQEYFVDPEGRWPGVRSKPLHKLNAPFFLSTCRKFFSQFYDLKTEEGSNVQWVVSMNFQIVNGNYESGWIHSDELSSRITGIVYLTPDSKLNGGTSIYREKKEVIQNVHRYNSVKEDAYLNKTPIHDVTKYREEHNAQFEETIRVSNVYNRLVCFDSHLHHGAQDFIGEGEDSRLTLVFFVSSLLAADTPVGRVRRTTQ